MRYDLTDHERDAIRRMLPNKPCGIPPLHSRTGEEPICLSLYLHRARSSVERFINKIKYCRRVATRYAKLAANHLPFVQLISIRPRLRVNESAS